MILHIIIGLNVGGAEKMVKRLSKSYPATTPSTIVVSLTSLGVIGESLCAQGVRVHTLGCHRLGIFQLRSGGWSN